MDIILGATISLLCAIATIAYNSISKRIRTVEENYSNKQEIRQLVEDKIGGLHADINEIKEKLDKLFDLYIEKIINDKIPK